MRWNVPPDMDTDVGCFWSVAGPRVHCDKKALSSKHRERCGNSQGCPPYAGAYPWKLICQFDNFWDCPIFSSRQSQKGSCCLLWVCAKRRSATIPQRHMASKQQWSLCSFGPQQLPSDNAAKATFIVVIICLCLNPCICCHSYIYMLSIHVLLVLELWIWLLWTAERW